MFQEYLHTANIKSKDLCILRKKKSLLWNHWERRWHESSTDINTNRKQQMDFG